MDVGKYTPNDAVQDDIAWKPACVKLWLVFLDNGHDVWKWMKNVSTIQFYKSFFTKTCANKKIWCSEIKKKLEVMNLHESSNINVLLHKSHLTLLGDILFNNFINDMKKI